jgi:hypothetical protein
MSSLHVNFREKEPPGDDRAGVVSISFDSKTYLLSFQRPTANPNSTTARTGKGALVH